MTSISSVSAPARYVPATPLAQKDADGGVKTQNASANDSDGDSDRGKSSLTVNPLTNNVSPNTQSALLNLQLGG